MHTTGRSAGQAGRARRCSRPVRHRRQSDGDISGGVGKVAGDDDQAVILAAEASETCSACGRLRLQQRQPSTATAEPGIYTADRELGAELLGQPASSPSVAMSPRASARLAAVATISSPWTLAILLQPRPAAAAFRYSRRRLSRQDVLRREHPRRLLPMWPSAPACLGRGAVGLVANLLVVSNNAGSLIRGLPPEIAWRSSTRLTAC